MTIKEKYEFAKNNPSDINEHIESLYGFSLQCKKITEMGVRGVVSTWAFLNSRPERLICYDIGKHLNVDEALLLADKEGIAMEFIEANVLNIEIDETDFLFIDTFHSATQLERELQMHATKVNKYIGFHDTTTYWEKGEPSYEGMGDVACGRGLKYALEPFLENNPEWKIVYRTNKNNGLTIIEKKSI